MLPAAIAAVLAATLTATLPAGPARAAQGSVPPIVATFVEERLLDELGQEDPRAPDGIPLDVRNAGLGPIVQVFFFTEDARAGRDVEEPVVPRPEWVIPVLVGGQPVGVAIVTSDLDGPDVRLDSYRPDVTLATEAARLGGTAALVNDPVTSAWFSVDGGTVWPVVTGTSGVASARPLDRMDLDHAPPRIDPISPGTVGALAAFAGLLALALITLAVPRLLRRRLDPDDRRVAG